MTDLQCSVCGWTTTSLNGFFLHAATQCPTAQLPTIEERLERSSEPGPNGCRLWTGFPSDGYGRICINYKFYGAHRIAYELRNGPIPDGLQIDHLCRTPLCINPDHMEAVTPAENSRRANANKPYCVNGHALTPENVYVRSGGKHRECRTCTLEKQRARRARRSA